MRRVYVLVLVLLTLAGCGGRGSDGPAPVVYGEKERDRGASETYQDGGTATAGPGIHTVRRGETLSEIATAYRVDMEALASVNDLQPPYRLRIGQPLRIPRPRLYKVVRGDTVYGVSRRFRVPIRAIIEANDLSPPYGLDVGQTLRVPQPRRHEVAKGDTLYSISRRYSVNLSDLARLNGLTKPYTIRPGQILLIPSSGSDVAVARAGDTSSGPPPEDAPSSSSAGKSAKPQAATETSPTTDRTNTAAGTDSGTSRPTAVRIPKPRSKPTAIKRKAAAKKTADDGTQQAATRPKAVPKPPSRSSSRFAWPLRGKIVTRYGPQEGGLHNDGVNIAAAMGTPVKAAENGVVAYVGNELEGFGNLILLKHADNWITAYAHLDEILVERGQRVGRGDRIARVGSSGGVTKPQLHFETRRGTDAVNPEKIMGSASAAIRLRRAGSQVAYARPRASIKAGTPLQFGSSVQPDTLAPR